MGNPILRGKGQFLRKNVAVHCKVMGHSMVSCAMTAEPIEIRFRMKIRLAKQPFVTWGAYPPTERGNFRSLRRSLQKGIIQSPISSCSRRDHSVCQASAISIIKIYGRRQCGLSATKKWSDCTARAMSDIYDCAVYCMYSVVLRCA